MKIKLLVSRICAVNGSQNAGEIIDVDNREGERMLAVGQAELVRAKAPQRAVKKPRAEKASK